MWSVSRLTEKLASRCPPPSSPPSLSPKKEKRKLKSKRNQKKNKEKQRRKNQRKKEEKQKQSPPRCFLQLPETAEKWYVSKRDGYKKSCSNWGQKSDFELKNFFFFKNRKNKKQKQETKSENTNRNNQQRKCGKKNSWTLDPKGRTPPFRRLTFFLFHNSTSSLTVLHPFETSKQSEHWRTSSSHPSLERPVAPSMFEQSSMVCWSITGRVTRDTCSRLFQGTVRTKTSM